MLPKRNLISATIGAAFLFTLSTTTTFAADATKENQHQHQTAKSSAKDSADHQMHQCDHKMSSVDVDKDGKISKDEFIKHHEQMFEKMDANKDGFLDESEMHHMMGHKHMHDMHDHGSQSKESSGHSHPKK